MQPGYTAAWHKQPAAAGICSSRHPPHAIKVQSCTDCHQALTAQNNCWLPIHMAHRLMLLPLQVWDLRVKRSVQTFEGKYQVLAVAFAEAGDQVRLLGGPSECFFSSHLASARPSSCLGWGHGWTDGQPRHRQSMAILLSDQLPALGSQQLSLQTLAV